MTIETKRLILRAPVPEDAERYAALCGTEFVMRYNAMSQPDTQRIRSRFAQDNEGVWLLTDRETGEVMGEITVDEDSLRYGVASRELSYWIGEQYSRKGYMKEAMEAVISHLFETEDLTCVSARCFAPNEASLALLRSLGFHRDGYIPQCVKGYKDQIFDDTLHSRFRK